MGTRARYRHWLIAAVTLAVSLWSLTPAKAEDEIAREMRRGIIVSAAQCQYNATSVWVVVGRYGVCMKYYISTAGGQGPVPIVWMDGDQANQTKFDAKGLQDEADELSVASRSTAIYLARMGNDGSSGSHELRHTWFELYVTHAALNALRQRYRFVAFHLAGQSGGSLLLGGLMMIRNDIKCAVPGAGRLAALDKLRPRSNKLLVRMNPAGAVRTIQRNRPHRIIVITDPADQIVRIQYQSTFVVVMRSTGFPVEHFAVQAGDDQHHGVTRFTKHAVAACSRGMTNQQIAGGLREVQQVVWKIAERRRARKARQASAAPSLRAPR